MMNQFIPGLWSHCFTTAWALALWRASWQGGLALLLVWAACRYWLAMPPRWREWLWRLAYLKLLLAWLWAGTLALHILPVRPYQPASAPVAQSSPAPVTETPSPQSVTPVANTAKPTTISAKPVADTTLSPTPSHSSVSAHHWQFADLLPLLGITWLLGVAWGGVRLLLAVWHVQRLRGECRPVGDMQVLKLRVQVVKQMGLRKAPMLMAHPTAGPLLLGTFHPIIIVPEAMLVGDSAELRLALAHELAHVRRLDIGWGWMTALVELFFFFHPLVYPARRESRLAQEIACDALALAGTDASPREYGAMLMNGVLQRAHYRPVPVAVGILESFSTLHRRLSAMKTLNALSPRQRLLSGTLACAMTLVLLVPWRLVAADDLAQIHIAPPPTQPVPNARDIYLKACAKEVVQLPSVDQQEPPITRIFDMSVQGIAPGGIMPQSPGSTNTVPAPTLAQMQALLSANQPAFELLRQGFTAEYCEIPCRSSSVLFPHFGKFREMSRALAADAYTRSCAGDWSGAMTSSLDGLRLGEDIPHGGIIMSLLVGIAIQNIARKQTWQIVPHLSAAEAAAATHRLETIMARHVPFADILQEEKWMTEASLLEAFNNPKLKEMLQQDPNADQKTKDYFTHNSVSTIVKQHAEYMDAMIAREKQPYAAQSAEPKLPDNSLPQAMRPVFGKGRFKEIISTTQNALLLTTLALQSYFAQYHQYPEKLSTETLTDLKAIPADPFAVNQPLRYKRTATGYLLYSIGPDGKDDGGAPCSEGQKTAAPVTRNQSGDSGVQQDSTGDIVAGVNIH